MNFIYGRVAVGKKYPCLWICLLWELQQSLLHVQLVWNLNTKQSLYVHPFCLWPDENPLAWSGAIHLKKGNNFGCKYSYLHGKSGIIRVLTSEYKMMTGCLILVAWSHIRVPWYTIRGYISLNRYFEHQIVYKILVWLPIFSLFLEMYCSTPG